ncbi:alpha-ketoglutarate-dependent dioxygenase AlkB family protein [Sphingoaurantiacus capsulatus]|uniref:Alpha-ketoglutarate-dependent dioxygenase AlkB family protein n=1 Tax=Sphingoaurantiacus capsulatus TaxID=1771310 RepID=A0ABV7XCB8_9SPHN
MSNLFEHAKQACPIDLPQEEGYASVWREDLRGYIITVPNGELFYSERFFDRKVSDRSVEYFQENESLDWKNVDWRKLSSDDINKISFSNLRWKQDWINFYGKRVPLPRLTSWYGDEGKSYTYSGIKSQPNSWNKGLLYIKHAVENCAGVNFNSVLLNWYRDGEDSLSWHADNEKELGENPTIASVNFGETRDFLLRRNDNKSTKLSIPLKHGTVLIMRGALQHFWEHSVPKRKSVHGSRFNLTFRQIGS